jgi:hypothetical protein
MWSATPLDIPTFRGMVKKPTNPGLDEMDDHKLKKQYIKPYKTIAIYNHNHE